MKGLFNRQDMGGSSRQPKQYEPVDHERADKLLQAIVGRKFRIASVDKWPQYFAQLRAVVPARRIDRALDWLCRHLGQDGVPSITSAKWFRYRFVDIEAAMRRARNGPVAELADTIQLSPQIKRLAAELREELRWPADEAKFVPYVAQLSYDNYDAFLDWLSRYGKQDPRGPRLQRFAYRTMTMLPWDRVDVVDAWLRNICEMANEMGERWHGRLMSYVLEPEGRRFAKLYGYPIANHWSGDAELWDQLINEYLNNRP